MNITAIIITGKHGGERLCIPYSPTIKMPVLHERQISIGEKHDHSVKIGDYIEYQECFRSVDGKCVLYAQSGKWHEITYAINRGFRPTSPVLLF